MAWGTGGWGEGPWSTEICAVVEAAGAKDVPAAALSAPASLTERASAHDAPVVVAGVTNFTIIERASIKDRLLAIQIGAAFIIERAGITEQWIGLPVFLGAIVERANAHELASLRGTLVAAIVEQASALDVVTIGGSSTFGLDVVERARAQDVPDTQIMRFIEIIEAALANDAAFSLTDLWVPVDDSQSGIWVPVNDNPVSPWLPAIP